MRISYWPNLKSAAQVIFKIYGIVCHKFLPVMWPRPRPFGENIVRARSAFPRGSCVLNLKTLAKVILKIMFYCMPKSLGVTWPRPRPFWGKLFERPLAFPQLKQCTKFEVSSSSSFEDTFDRIPKIFLGSRDVGHAPFGENFCIFQFRFAKI